MPCPGADEDDRNLVRRLVRQQVGGDGPARDPGHHDVEQDRVRPVELDADEGFVAVRRLEDAESGLLQGHAAQRARALVVVDDEH